MAEQTCVCVCVLILSFEVSYQYGDVANYAASRGFSFLCSQCKGA